MQEVNAKVPFKEKICYACSAIGGNVPSFFVMGYLTLFATDILGLKASTVGLLVMIGSVIDAFTDLFITNFADRTKTRWGKYRPWLLWAGIPVAVLMVALFWYPDFLSNNITKALWVFIGYLLLSPVCLTAYLCPQYVMLSLITNNKHERMSLGSARTIGETASDLIVNSLAMTLILLFGQGDYRSILGWRYVVLLLAAVSLLGCIAGFLGVKERVEISNTNIDGTTLSLGTKLKTTFKNRAYRKTLLLYFSIMIPTVETILLSYFVIHVLGHENWLSLVAVSASAASILSMVLVPQLGKKLDLQQIINLGSLFVIAGAIVCIFTNGLTGVLFFAVLKGLGYGMTVTAGGILWTTCADHIEKETKLAIPGVVMATGSFAAKVLVGICSYIGTLILTLGKYDNMAMTQTLYTQNWIRYGIIVFMCAGSIMSIIVNRFLVEYRQDAKTENQ